jgi:thiosulfate dehydrogenase
VCSRSARPRRNVMPWVGVYARFPQYRARSGRVIDLEERVGDCFERSLNGRSPAYDSPEMRDIIAYMAWLSRGTPVGRETEGQGIPMLAPWPADTGRGRVVFLAECARCHGEDGQGLVPPATPLWGDRSYNIGAGMARLRTAAAFIRAGMPLDRPNTLTPQQAYDVAAYVNGHRRPDFKGKENDWPNGDPPPDVAYPTRAARRR